MSAPTFELGAYVLGPPTSRRQLVKHDALLNAYADGVQADKGEEREAYLSAFVFGAEFDAHYRANRNSVAGFSGPCGARWLIFDIDRAELAEAIEGVRKLVRTLHERYPELDGRLPIYFSGSKGFHVLLELAHKPPPSVGFHRVCRTLAEALAAIARIRIDTAIYDAAHIIRLPNTRHPKTGLCKVRVDADTLFSLTVDAIRDRAKQPSSDGILSISRTVPQLAKDWDEAEARTVVKLEDRAAIRRDAGPVDARAPRWFMEFIRFGVVEGERHQTLFRSAAWMTEQGALPSLCLAILTEPGRDVGLSPADVDRQIQCGIDHARRQRGTPDPKPDPLADPDAFERWAIEHGADPLPPGAMSFPFGALEQSEGGPR